jgi:hypothetical protein
METQTLQYLKKPNQIWPRSYHLARPESSTSDSTDILENQKFLSLNSREDPIMPPQAVHDWAFSLVILRRFG